MAKKESIVMAKKETIIKESYANVQSQNSKRVNVRNGPNHINSQKPNVDSCNQSQRKPQKVEQKPVMKSQNYGKPNDLSVDHPLFNISAHSFAILDCMTNQFPIKKKESLKREVASLTKIMTFYTVLKLISKWQINSRTYSI
jgi:hypothetical protein